MSNEPGLFETMYGMRAMRRLKPDPVPPHLIDRIIDAGTHAPSGQNTQPWAFLVVTEAEGKLFFGSRYRHWMLRAFGDGAKAMDPTSPLAGSVKAAMYLAEHMHEVPVLLIVCGKRDWPFSVPADHRLGKAPPSYGSVYPCVQNMLLAARALGLGASLTTMHQMFEEELEERFAIPADYGIVAVLPIGFPKGRFGPVSREPAALKTHFESWGNQRPA